MTLEFENCFYHGAIFVSMTISEEELFSSGSPADSLGCVFAILREQAKRSLFGHLLPTVAEIKAHDQSIANQPTSSFAIGDTHKPDPWTAWEKAVIPPQTFTNISPGGLGIQITMAFAAKVNMDLARQKATAAAQAQQTDC